MLTREEARSRVLESIRAMGQGDGSPLRLLDEATIERPWGWVFFYDSGETGEPLFGNAPILVNRATGELAPSGTSAPAEFYIRRYERTLFWRRLRERLLPRGARPRPMPRFPAGGEEARRVFRRWDARNGRYFFIADVRLADGEIVRDVTFDGATRLAVEVDGRPVYENPRLFGATIAAVLVLQECSTGTAYLSTVTDADREAFARGPDDSTRG